LKNQRTIKNTANYLKTIFGISLRIEKTLPHNFSKQKYLHRKNLGKNKSKQLKTYKFMSLVPKFLFKLIMYGVKMLVEHMNKHLKLRGSFLRVVFCSEFLRKQFKNNFNLKFHSDCVFERSENRLQCSR
jgi:hypothetical protein